MFQIQEIEKKSFFDSQNSQNFSWKRKSAKQAWKELFPSTESAKEYPTPDDDHELKKDQRNSLKKSLEKFQEIADSSKKIGWLCELLKTSPISQKTKHLRKIPLVEFSLKISKTLPKFPGVYKNLLPNQDLRITPLS